jgi:hypothetical protein
MPEIHLDDGRRVPYSIRISPRSRRVRLTLNPRDGLVMVSPPGVDNAELAALATSWRDWIARQLDEMGIADLAARERRRALPENIALPALGEDWGVLYRYAPAAAPRVREKGASAIVLGGDVSDHPACVSALRRWLMRRARQTLPECLERVAAETRLDFATCRSAASAAAGAAARRRATSASTTSCCSCRRTSSATCWCTSSATRSNSTTRRDSGGPLPASSPIWIQLREEMRRSWSHVPGWLLAAI